ncbi:MAG: cytochrome c biogenesis protein [Actinomycetota bacterium]|nr:cytochrome c biogenesis protein [Actinomycetota bacterium]
MAMPVHRAGETRETTAGREPESIRAGTGSMVGFAAVLTGSAVLASVLAPPDAVQGQWQRLMYIHVPAAWAAYLAFAGVLAASVVQLRRLSQHRDTARARRWAQACAEVGVAATGLTLVAGSIWGHAVWGVWWAWDARLVSTALMFLIYVGYLGVLAMSQDEPGIGQPRVRAAAWAGVAGFVVVPVVHFSVVWWTTLHQQATVLAPPTQAPPLDPRMAVALSLSVLASTVVGAVVVLQRVRHLVEDQAAPRAADPAAARRRQTGSGSD